MNTALQYLFIINRGTIHFSNTAFDADPQPDELSATLESAPATPSTPPPTAPRFAVFADTVFDTTTRLEWSRRPIAADRKTFAEAEKAVAELRLGGHSDWRLPTREELQGLVDYSRYNPAIDVDAFPDTPSNYFWSSSPDASDPEDAWLVGFGNGGVNLYHRDYSAFVRAVRSVPASQ